MNSVGNIKRFRTIRTASLLLVLCLRIAAQELSTTRPLEKLDPGKRETRADKPSKPRRYDLNMSHHMVKYNLSKLSYYSRKRYLNTLEPLETLFMRLDELPEETKTKMLALTMTGITAQESFRMCRRYLTRYKINFIYPNLNGLNLHYTVRPLQTRLLFRLTSPVDRYYGVQRGAYTFYHQQTPYSNQQLLYRRLSPQVQVFGLASHYPTVTFYGCGLSWYRKDALFYTSAVVNADNRRDIRLAVIINLVIQPPKAF